MGKIAFVFVLCSLAGCTTLTKDERIVLKEIDGWFLSESDSTDIHSLCLFAGYLALSDEERASLKMFNGKYLEGSEHKDINDLTTDEIKSFRDCLTPDDINFIRGNGFGFDPVKMNMDSENIDLKYMGVRQKIILTKVFLQAIMVEWDHQFEVPIKSACILLGYLALSERERTSLGELKETDHFTADDIKAIRDLSQNEIESFHKEFPSSDIEYIRHGGFGFNPKQLNDVDIDIDTQNLSLRQKLILFKLFGFYMGILISAISSIQ